MTEISEIDQDYVLFNMIEDTAFLSQCVRKKLHPEHFTSDIRRILAKLSIEFYLKYEKAPLENLLDLIDQYLINRGKEDETKAFHDEIDRIYRASYSEKSSRYILDRIEEFVKHRVIMAASNEILKLKERIGSKSDKILSIMRSVLLDTDQIEGKSAVESILDDSDIEPLKVVTRFNVPVIDNQLRGGLKLGDFAILLGYTNRGKSWAINHLAKMATRIGYSPLVMPIEMPNKKAKLRFHMSFSGMTESEVYSNRLEVKKRTKGSLLRKSNLFLLGEDEKEMSVDRLPAVLEEIRIKYGKEPKLILIDSADDMLPPSGVRYKEQLTETTAKYVWLKNFAKDNEICVVTTVQAQRRGETMYWLKASTVSDDINKARKATVGISLNANDIEDTLGYLRLFLFKNTDGKVGARAWIKTDFERGQFSIDNGRYNKLEYDELISAASKL